MSINGREITSKELWMLKVGVLGTTIHLMRLCVHDESKYVLFVCRLQEFHVKEHLSFGLVKMDPTRKRDTRRSKGVYGIR